MARIIANTKDTKDLLQFTSAIPKSRERFLVYQKTNNGVFVIQGLQEWLKHARNKKDCMDKYKERAISEVGTLNENGGSRVRSLS